MFRFGKLASTSPRTSTIGVPIALRSSPASRQRRLTSACASTVTASTSAEDAAS